MANTLIPLPQAAVSVRVATPADVPFIDRLQKLHGKQVGFMPTGQLLGKIAAGEVLIAEEVTGQKSEVSEDGGESPRLTSDLRPLTSVGYVIGQDRYFKHDDVGVIYQLNVAPGRQRGFVGATLLKAMFDRAAYGCRLFCCWCAQDIEANRFWESMGFVPLAYRAGSEKNARVHIFWQKRIRAGDTTTPWWFPSQTTGGAIREDRLVFPIPPGTHWSDAKPVILPGETRGDGAAAPRALPGPRKPKAPAPAKRPVTTASRRLSFGPAVPAEAPGPAEAEAKLQEKKPPERKPRPRNDPRLVAAARELKDRWLEHVNGGGAGAAALTPIGKYDVTRSLPAMTTTTPATAAPQLPGLVPLLPAA